MIEPLQGFTDVGWMTPGDFKHFPLADRDAAIAWAAADD
jgi:hypothetical protein